MPAGERQQVERDTQLSIYRLQTEAYRNLRHSVAAAVVIFGLFVGSDALLGDAEGARLWPCLILLLSAVLGAGYFGTTGARPRLGLQLLAAAVLATVIGVVALIVVR